MSIEMSITEVIQDLPITEVEAFDQGAQIKVIGIGGCGGNAVAHMIAQEVQGVEFICANTDAQDLNRSQADKLIQLGETGLGAGCRADGGRAAAQAAEHDIRAAISGAQMLFITAGMGGGTGTGGAPVVARIAQEMGILTIGVVTKPFNYEGATCLRVAEQGLTELEAHVDSLIVVDNTRLLDVDGGEDLKQSEAFAMSDDVLKNAVSGIVGIITKVGLINLDFNDVNTVMRGAGRSLMGTATATGPDRARVAAELAISCPLLDGIEAGVAKKLLVHISASKDSLRVRESQQALEVFEARKAPDAEVVHGISYDDSLGEQLRITVIATGLSDASAQRRGRPTIEVVHRTGTDDAVGYSGVDLAFQAATGAHADAASLLGTTDYAQMESPRVWRNNRHSSTMAGQAISLSSGGMDEMDIPAIYRKQAD